MRGVLEKGGAWDWRARPSGERVQMRMSDVTGRNEPFGVVPGGGEVRKRKEGAETKFTIRQALIQRVGGEGLLGREAMKMSLRKMRARWPGLAKGLSEWAKNRGKQETQRYKLGMGGYVRIRHLNMGMFREAGVDLIGPYRYKKTKARGAAVAEDQYGAIMVERFTRYTWGGVAVGKEAAVVARAIQTTQAGWPVRPYLVRGDNAFGGARGFTKLTEEVGF